MEAQNPEVESKTCPNCGYSVDEDTTFCPECGSNIFSGKRQTQSSNLNETHEQFVNDFDAKKIIVPTLFALIASIILSLIFFVIGFSWFSCVLAIIIAVGFFAGTVDGKINAIVLGAITGVILGSLEMPLVKWLYGTFVAGIYKGVFGEHIWILIIVGVVMGYISNVYLKDHIRGIVDKK